ncbi:methyltransferase family protein [Candidatus Methanoperedens nitroreducens]|uniref:Methyltransferase family protein n=1 Tax=Candidatus Methanoperedens nitratireducens TaxID=1392998 RepID=A0A062V462_9EURY|nr:class I SAM-dependent methyltransferase [Candidatus Methanoperedens nitroreducens]KCZ72132.1 methyltransferase family protein [Candidatus Methanoperedens nitroreducens]MDJ1421891.1 class I SAM-dependent methyltransferase [Candidatus Methanoperedens sp.]
MLIHGILGLGNRENIYFVEDSYASLKNNTLSLHYLENISKDPPDEIYGIEDENGSVIGLVIYNPETEDTPGFWSIFTDIVSSKPAPNESSRRFSNIAGNLRLSRLHRTTCKEFNRAVIEYYSLALVNRQLCENCHISKEPYDMIYIESRRSRLKELLDRYKLRGDMLEICCGNGMSTLPLHEMGYAPVAIDFDKCQVCQGLEHSVLEPERTIVLDATSLSQFFHENTFDTVSGFMLGTIYPFNRGIWEGMMSEAVKVLKPGGMILLTVNKREEIEVLKCALEMNRITGSIIDNTDGKGIYDQWVYVGSKSSN